MLVRDYAARNAAIWPEREAYVSATARLTWGQVVDRAWRLAAALRRLGVEKGDFVASMATDTHELAEIWLACCALGAVRVGVNYRYPSDVVGHVLRDSACRAVIVQGGYCEELFSAISARDRAAVTAVIGFGPHTLETDYEAELSGNDPLRPEDWDDLDRSDPALVGYTSGSTALPKGVLSSHRAVLSMGLNTWYQAGLRPDERYLHCLPTGGGVNILMATWNVFNGATVILLDRFDAAGALDAMEREKVTSAFFVPTMIVDLLNSPSFRETAIRTVRLVLYGAAPATPSLIRRAMSAFNCEFQQWYGTTETNVGALTILHFRDHLAVEETDPGVLASVGRPTLHTELRIIDSDGNDLPTGEVGTVSVRSDTLMERYMNLPEETARVLNDGWLRLGDLGRKDEQGYVYLVDREDFRILSGGYNVYPALVENVLAQHSNVCEVCVFGVPDERWGEAVVAVVVPFGDLDVPQLREFCRGRLAAFEVPKVFELVAELPRGATGKVAKRDLRDRFLGHGNGAGAPRSDE
jgi:acyl-CoA synthetase (AMP-forming)/AMP-acid ligase II